MQTLYRRRDWIGAASAGLMLGTMLLALASPVEEKTIIAAAEVTRLQLSEPEPESKVVVPVQPKPTISVRPPPIATLPAPSQSSVKADAPSPTSVVASVVSKAVLTDAAPSTAVSPLAVSQTVPTKLVEPPRQAPPPAVTQTVAQTERYEAQILRYLESIKRYPSSREARQTRPAGIVTVWFDLSRAGRVLEAGIEKSSNSSLLDAVALKTVRTG